MLFLSCLFAGTAFAHSYQVCFASRVQVCQDYFPPSMRLECVISAIGSCATHTHGSGGFAPIELPFGTRTFPGLDEVLKDKDIGTEYKELAREALDALRLHEEARTKEFNAILRAKTLQNRKQEEDKASDETKK